MDGLTNQAQAAPAIIASHSGVPRWKRALDIGCIVLALPVVVPLMGLIAAFIKIVAPGPAFFRQSRIGYLESRFTCLKFRTMRVNADGTIHKDYLKQLISSNQPMTKMDLNGDNRLIPFGSWLRATGLDELPQLINVVRAQMSLVGPRPCTIYEYEQYLPWHKRRFETLPGLTGLWQVTGKNKTTFNEMIQLDIEYAQKKSLWLDLKIMLKTIPVLVLQSKEVQSALKKKCNQIHL